MEKNEWVCLGANANGIYTEVMNLGCIGLIRTYTWNLERGCAENASLIEIDADSASLLVASNRPNQD